jgi:hypothetical protein
MSTVYEIALEMFREYYGISADPERFPREWREAIQDARDYVADHPEYTE